MRIYVASKFENPRAPQIAAQLERAGHTITYKWWENSSATRQQAWNDFYGVRDADAFVLLVDADYRYSGALTEFGMALAWDKDIYIVGDALNIFPKKGVSPNIFTLLPGITRGIETLLDATHTTE